jgi:predicted ATPase
MKLTHFRVSNYKVIDDTGLVPVDGRVTALVGKNESGKTAILRALWKSRNVSTATFDKLYDYPRDRYAKERKGNQQVVELRFQLTPAEESEVSNIATTYALDNAPDTSPFLSVSVLVSYQGEDGVSTQVKLSEETKAFYPKGQAAIQAIEAVERALSQTAGNAAIADASTAAKQTISNHNPLWDPPTVQALLEFDSKLKAWIDEDHSRSELGLAETLSLKKTLVSAQKGDPAPALENWVADNIPHFIYFDQYGQLETRIHLPAYLSRHTSSEPKIRTQTALFEHSNLDPQEIHDLGRARHNGETDESVHRRKEKRAALTDSASFSLTGDWNRWWAEKHHKLHFEADGDDLVLKVSDEYSEFKIPFEERSHGFQWFFSFYLVFLVESAKAHKGAILLLDEPGLSLHPTLQIHLIQFFEHISEDNQLIYTTHLPFLVDGNHLERVRTVYLSGEEPRKTCVSNDVRPAGDKDTLFPLQAALGYSIAQTLFMGKRTLIVEGITDYWLLKSLNSIVSATSSIPLAEDIVLIFAGGTSRLMPLASIMYATTGVGGEHLLILLDTDTEGLNAAKRVKEVFADDSRVLMLGDGINLASATIEDLIPRQDYVRVVGEATGHAITLDSTEANAPTNVDALSKAFQRCGYGKFDANERAKVALKLVELWSANPQSVPPDTLAKATSLFAAINKRFQ